MNIASTQLVCKTEYPQSAETLNVSPLPDFKAAVAKNCAPIFP
jgi:hypothetical protein